MGRLSGGGGVPVGSGRTGRLGHEGFSVIGNFRAGLESMTEMAPPPGADSLEERQ